VRDRRMGPARGIFTAGPVATSTPEGGYLLRLWTIMSAAEILKGFQSDVQTQKRHSRRMATYPRSAPYAHAKTALPSGMMCMHMHHS
jgi:hypothetical protein